MLFSEVMQLLKPGADGWMVTVPDDWMQGRSVFGGLQAAFAVHAMRALVLAALPLRTLQVTFLAPVPAGGVAIRAQVLRTGKNAQHVEARLMEGAQTLCIAIGVFGASRASTVELAPRQLPVPPGEGIEFRYIPGLTPTFTQHFSARWLRGGIPFTGDRSPEAVIELGLRDPGPASAAHVLALADFIPPVALSWLKTPAPGSSLTWMLEFLRDHYEDLPLAGWRVDAQMAAARDGYLSQSLTLWGPGGVPVALGRQSMVVFA